MSYGQALLTLTDFQNFEVFKRYLEGSIYFLKNHSLLNQEVHYQNFIASAINFVSNTLQKLFEILEGFYKVNEFFLFLPCGKLSHFFWEILEETKFLGLPIWEKLFVHPTMSCFQKFVFEKQSNILKHLQSLQSQK